jgi:hypothetical protein
VTAHAATGLVAGLLALAATACQQAPAELAVCVAASAAPLSGAPLELGGRGGIAADREGGLYVLDSRAAELTALSPSGQKRWRAGREGAGPGEFIHGTGLQWAGGRLVFRDLENHRLSFWMPDGRSAGEVPLPRFRFPGYPGWVGVLDTGTVAAAIPPAPRFTGHAPPEDGMLVLARSGSSTVDTLLRFAFPPTVMRPLPGGGRAPGFPRMAAFPQFAVAPEGLFVVPDGSRYRIEAFDGRGRRTATFSGPDGNPPVTARDREEYLENAQPGSSDADDFPSHFPAVAELYTGMDGTLLVKTFWTRDGAVRWDRWSATDGRFLHSFTLPESVQDATPAGDRIYAVGLDSLDVPVIRAFRLEGTGQCPGPSVAGSSPAT